MLYWRKEKGKNGRRDENGKICDPKNRNGTRFSSQSAQRTDGCRVADLCEHGGVPQGHWECDPACGAGGGGGSDGATRKNGLYGGGTSGGTASQSFGTGGGGGTQTAGGAGGSSNSGSFGQGGNGLYRSSGYAGAGGGGWYGGGGSYPDGSGDDDRGGGGGSGYVYTSSTASNYPSGCLLNSEYYLTDAATYAGNTSFVGTSGSNETGHSGDGYCRITVLELYTSFVMSVNIGSTWKEVDSAYVNIGGTWKEVEGIWTNIGGSWKESG